MSDGHLISPSVRIDRAARRLNLLSFLLSFFKAELVRSRLGFMSDSIHLVRLGQSRRNQFGPSGRLRVPRILLSQVWPYAGIMILSGPQCIIYKLTFLSIFFFPLGRLKLKINFRVLSVLKEEY